MTPAPPPAWAVEQARDLVDRCQHTSFAKVDPADTHGACANCVALALAAAVEARDAALREADAELWVNWKTKSIWVKKHAAVLAEVARK